MGAQVLGATIIGVKAHQVLVEAEIIGSLRRFALVGLPDGVLREAKDRVRCALEFSGFEFPHGEVVVNLAPAALPKRGAGFDLSIALSVLAAAGQIPAERLKATLAYGELRLNGSLKAVGGELAVVAQAKEQGVRSLYLAREAAGLCAIDPDVTVFGVSTIAELVAHLLGQRALRPFEFKAYELNEPPNCKETLDDVLGQIQAKRALELSAAGGHNILLVGPPGSGKSMLAQRLPSLLPPLSLQESVEVAAIQSLASDSSLPQALLSSRAPYRAPHHSSSVAGLVGGGSIPRPGEITLAHRGVLFLDEVAELRRDALEALRMPLESQHISVSRSRLHVDFPADCLVIAAMNPCPCGQYASSARNKCRCSDQQRRRYFERLSGPIRDRFDLQVWVPPVEAQSLQSASRPSCAQQRKERVAQARQRQKKRNGMLNARLSGEALFEISQLDQASNKLLERAVQNYNLSARGYMRIVRLARTIADVEAQENITLEHLAESLAFRTTFRV